MPFVQWSCGVLPKVHITANRQKTFCGKEIPSHATETARRPRDKAKICKFCQQAEQYNKEAIELLR
jgi:hypothetical protein